MTTNRRLQLLTAFADAGDRGLTMTEGRFNCQDAINRIPGGGGIYTLTEQGQKYLEVVRPQAVAQ
jgi:hypothetical protein